MGLVALEGVNLPAVAERVGVRRPGGGLRAAATSERLWPPRPREAPRTMPHLHAVVMSGLEDESGGHVEGKRGKRVEASKTADAGFAVRAVASERSGARRERESCGARGLASQAWQIKEVWCCQSALGL
jgi:hypothetical protein